MRMLVFLAGKRVASKASIACGKITILVVGKRVASTAAIASINSVGSPGALTIFRMTGPVADDGTGGGRTTGPVADDRNGWDLQKVQNLHVVVARK